MIAPAWSRSAAAEAVFWRERAERPAAENARLAAQDTTLGGTGGPPRGPLGGGEEAGGTVEDGAVIDVDGQPGMYNVLLARTPASMAGRLITGNEITHAASLVCLLTHFGRDGRPS